MPQANVAPSDADNRRDRLRTGVVHAQKEARWLLMVDGASPGR
jgi:hypothetical protein